MSILTFIRSLAPVLERRDLLNVLDQLQVEYDDTLAPLVIDIREAFTGQKLNSVISKRMEQSMRRTINFNTSSLDLILKSLDNLRGDFEVIRKEIRTLFSVQFTNTNLTFERANLLKFIEGMAFYIRYSRKYLLFLVAQEAALLGKATSTVWSGAEQEWIDVNMDQFVSLYPAMSITGSDLKGRLNKASNATIDEGTFQLAQQTLGITKTDPLNLSSFSPRHNPFLALGKLVAEMQHARYNLAKEEYYGLQLRLEELRTLRSQQPASPEIQKRINEYEKRISNYEYKLAKVEERAGLN